MDRFALSRFQLVQFILIMLTFVIVALGSLFFAPRVNFTDYVSMTAIYAGMAYIWVKVT